MLVWKPQPGGQERFFRVPYEIFEVLLHGNRAGGKSDCLIMDFAREVGQGFGAEWNGMLFKRTNPELLDIQNKIRKWIPAIFPEAKIVQHPYFTIIWPEGERLVLRHMGAEKDYWSVHGANLAWLGWEELSNWPTPALYLKCNSLLRSAHPEVSRRKRLRATTNPGGAGHNWIRDRFQLPELDCVPISGNDKALAKKWMKDEVIVVDRLRMGVRLDLLENKILMKADPGYLDSLKQDANSEAQYRAWVYGDWNIVAGGMFDDVWDQSVHFIPAFDIPETWKINRSFDWGESKPFSVGWWAESDGSDVRLKNGRWAATVRGDLFRIGEWYGWNGQPNEGCKLTSTEIARGMVERELAMGIYHRCKAGPADSAIFDGFDGKDSIAQEMAKPVRLANGRVCRGISWTPARKGPGSRITGWSLMRTFLKNAQRRGNLPRENPGLFIFDNCLQFSRTVPVLPRDEKKPDDVDTEAEDHIGDETRYRLIEVNRGVSSGTEK